MNGHLRRVARALLAGLLILLAGSAHADETLTYDPNGNVVTRALPGSTTAYTYDDLDRATGEAGPAKTQTLTYDPNGNRTGDATGAHTYTANTDRQLTIAGQSVTLDAAGNITQARNLGFVWNAAGQLAEVHQGSPSGTLIASYTYDYQGRRTRKVTNGSGSLNSRTTIYTYDQYDRLSGEYDGAGHPRRTYVWRDAVPLTVINHFGTTEVAYYLETDHLGSPIAARDPDGNVVWRWVADAFGSSAPNEDADGDGGAVTINLRFPGQYFDQESGLHYNWHRYYDPKLGRYLSSDPIGIAGGSNTYIYVRGNPISRRDPSGLVDINLFNPSDPAYRGAAAAPSPPNTITVGGHGNPSLMTDPQGNILSAAQLANLIKNYPNYNHGMVVQLMSCNVGLSPGGNQSSFAQQVSNALGSGSVVLGANNFVWYYSNGNTAVAPTNTPGVTWQNYTPAAGASGPNLSAPGGYNRASTP